MEYELTFTMTEAVRKDGKRIEQLEYAIISIAEYLGCQMTGNIASGITIEAGSFADVARLIRAISDIESEVGVTARNL